MLGYSYGTHLFDAAGKASINKEKGCVEVVLEAQGDTQVRYTLDGSIPGPDSPLYTEPIEIRETCVLKAKSDRPGMGERIWEKHFNAHKAMGRPVEALTATHPNYTYNSPDLLTDGIIGTGPYNSGDFAGWYNVPFEAVIEMDGCEYSEVTLSTVVFKYDWVFGPKSITVYTSEDGQTYSKVASKAIKDIDNMDEGNGCLDYTVKFAKTTAKYLKIVAESYKELPEWHAGAGHPGFLFVDEVIVK